VETVFKVNNTINIGGRCINGPSVEDCIYDNVTDYGAEKCNGFMHLVKIPNSYSCVN